jgi:hypothetical protein
MAVHYNCRGLQVHWAGHLHGLEAHAGVAVASGLDIALQWPDTPGTTHAWLLREPTATGLVQSLALLSPNGELRLLLGPLHAQARPQPCAWRAALHAACGDQIGMAC